MPEVRRTNDQRAKHFALGLDVQRTAWARRYGQDQRARPLGRPKRAEVAFGDLREAMFLEDFVNRLYAHALGIDELDTNNAVPAVAPTTLRPPSPVRVGHGVIALACN